MSCCGCFSRNVFAQGCDFYKLMLLFVIGAFLGDIVKTVFCRITMGYWMSRSSLVWGPFSIVWGLALALVTWFLYKYKDHSESFLFWQALFLAALMNICAVYLQRSFSEKYFGITVNYHLILEKESIFCIAFSGESQQLYGSKKYIPFFLAWSRKYRWDQARSLPGSWLYLCVAIWSFLLRHWCATIRGHRESKHRTR